MRDYRDVPDADAPDGEAPRDVFDRLWDFLKAAVKSFFAALERL